MKIVFSRKGFDTQNGFGPSPIVDGRPVSLPIPDTKGLSRTTYAQLGLGDHAVQASGGKIRGDALCHHDPMFTPDGRCYFGQCQSAQGHLANEGIGPGDVFLFFGLFARPDGERHHRLFGYLEVEQVVPIAGAARETLAPFDALDHPHAIGMHGTNDHIYAGPGGLAQTATDDLRLTVPGGPLTLWKRPHWLERGGLTYFGTSDRNWPDGCITRTGPGQEFVADIGHRKAPREWLAGILAAMKG